MGRELEGVEREKILIRIYCMREESIMIDDNGEEEKEKEEGGKTVHHGSPRKLHSCQALELDRLFT